MELLVVALTTETIVIMMVVLIFVLWKMGIE